MFGSVNLTAEPPTWKGAGLSFPRMYHALLTFGAEIVALGGLVNYNGELTPTNDLFMYNMFGQTIDGLYLERCSGTFTVVLQCDRRRPCHY